MAYVVHGASFPFYPAHDDASCFNCGGDWRGSAPMRSGNAPGRGEWFQCCERCGMRTFYDVEKTEPNQRTPP